MFLEPVVFNFLMWIIASVVFLMFIHPYILGNNLIWTSCIILIYFIRFRIFLFFLFGSAASRLLCRLCSLVASRGYYLVAVRGLLIAVASLVGSRVQALVVVARGSVLVAPGLWSTHSVVVVHRLSCCAACGIFADQGLNLCLLHWQADSLPLSHQGSPSGKLWFWVDEQNLSFFCLILGTFFVIKIIYTSLNKWRCFIFYYPCKNFA